MPPAVGIVGSALHTRPDRMDLPGLESCQRTSSGSTQADRSPWVERNAPAKQQAADQLQFFVIHLKGDDGGTYLISFGANSTRPSVPASDRPRLSPRVNPAPSPRAPIASPGKTMTPRRTGNRLA